MRRPCSCFVYWRRNMEADGTSPPARHKPPFSHDNAFENLTRQKHSLKIRLQTTYSEIHPKRILKTANLQHGWGTWGNGLLRKECMRNSAGCAGSAMTWLRGIAASRCCKWSCVSSTGRAFLRGNRKTSERVRPVASNALPGLPIESIYSAMSAFCLAADSISSIETPLLRAQERANCSVIGQLVQSFDGEALSSWQYQFPTSRRTMSLSGS